MRLPRAGTLPGSRPRPARVVRVCFQSDRSPRERTSLTSPHRPALRLERSPLKESARTLQHRRLSSCRSRGARARVGSSSFSRRHCALDPDSLPPRRDLLGLGPSRGPSIDLAADRVPARSYRRSLPPDVTRMRRSRRARSPPLSGRPECGLGLPGRVGAAWRRPRSSRPMSAAHGCCFQRRSPLRLGTRRIVMFPHDARGRGFTPQRPLRRADGSRRGVVFLDGRSRRRTSDAPSPAGSPGGAMSTGVGPRSCCDLRSNHPKA